MPESELHQLYCTHCTFGTSALHRHEGAIREEVFEYSARSASVKQTESHDTFRQIEPCLHFHLPPDTPAIEMRAMTAATCPWQRMVYYPAISGHKMLSRICYRQTDTRGRPGSYFAHVLLEKQSDNQSAWSALECLKLWGAPFWVSEDGEHLPFDLERLSSLNKISGYAAQINDKVLLSFLTTPSNSRFEDPGEETGHSVIPQRWREKPPSERQSLLIDLLRGFLELDWDRQERLIVAIEPSMAALIFYGILRCLPQKGLVERVSFSTFESHADRHTTTLVACTFHRPKIEELLPETYRSKAYVRDTYKDHPRRQFRHPDRRYANWVVSQLVRDGVEAVAVIVRDLEAAGAKTPEEWELAAIRHAQIEAVCAGTAGADFAKEPVSQAMRFYMGRVFGRILHKSSRAQVKELASNPAYLFILDLIGSQIRFEPCRKSTISLLNILPRSDTIRNQFLKLPNLAVEFKGMWLESYFRAKGGVLPGHLSALWTPENFRSGGVMSQLISRLESSEMGKAASNVPAELLPKFVGLVAEEVDRNSSKEDALRELIKQLKPNQIITLLATQSASVKRIYPPPQPQLASCLEQELSRIAADVGLFHARLDALVSGQIYLEKPALQNRIQAWVRFREAVKNLVKESMHLPGKAINSEADLERAQDGLLNAMRTVSGDLPCPPATASTLRFMKGVIQSLAGADSSAVWETVGRPLLARQVQRMDDDDVVELLSSDTADVWLQEYPQNNSALADRLRSVLLGIPSNGADLGRRVAVLLKTQKQNILIEESPQIYAWGRVAALMEKLRNLLRSDPQIMIDLPNVKSESVQDALRSLAEFLKIALHGQLSYNSKTDQIEKWDLISDLGQKYFDNLFLDNAKMFRGFIKIFLKS